MAFKIQFSHCVECFIVLVFLSSSTTPKEYSHDKEVALEELNGMREKIAEDMEIANMQKMVWDEGLAESAQKRIDEEEKCPKDLGKNKENPEIVMSFLMRDDKVLKEMMKEVLTPPKNRTNTTSKGKGNGIGNIKGAVVGQIKGALGAEKSEKKTEMNLTGITEGEDFGQLVKVWPTYSRVGCAECRVKKDSPLITLCHFGPKFSWKRSDVKKGTPGTECEKEKVVEDGMCADEFTKKEKKSKKEGFVSMSSDYPTMLLGTSLIFLFCFD